MLEPRQEARLAELFERALDLDGEARAAFLAEQRAEDPELAERLDELLAEDARGTRGVLRGSALGEEGGEVERLGPYRLVRVLGEGGMGTVHLAEQVEPVRRTVALKTIRLGGGAEVLERFESERQALARLGHPNVAKIHDAGTTPSGLPWFTMEYCPGPPIDEHCDRERLELTERVTLFLAVCDGVQHAHLRGVIHRDLKPSNVLVVQRDGASIPKIIDFGLARAVAGRLSPEARSSDPGRPVGTWLYMSPEQADPRGDVDARTDVWSLGVILYELLCGATPFEAGNTPALAASLLNDDVPAPTRRLAALPAERARAAAEARRTTGAELARRLRGDLDAICLRALERDRARRYATPSELAADLRRYLEGDPVEARPASGVYRLGKLARRHRVPLTSIVVVILAVWGALGWGWVQAARARDAERERAARVEHALLSAGVRAELLQLLLLEDPDLPLRELVARAEPRLDGMHVGDPRADAVARSALGGLWLELGEPARAAPHLERAWRALSGPAGGDDLQGFLALDALLRARRALGTPPRDEQVERCLELAQLLIGDGAAQLARALEGLLEEARAPGSSSERLRAALDEVGAQLERVERGRERTAPVARVLSEVAGALHGAGRIDETELVSRALEDLAERALDPGGVAILYFRWRLASALEALDPPLEARAAEVAERLLAGVDERGLDDEHWLRRAAHRLGAAGDAD